MTSFILTSLLVISPAAPGDAGGDLRLFLAAQCVGCHSPKKQAGDVRLDDLPADPSKAPARWAAVRDQLRDGLMPPPKQPRPEPVDVRGVVSQITASLGERPPPLPNQGNLVPHELLFGTPPQAVPPAPRVWRLSPDGYTGWLRDLYRGRLPQLAQPFTLHSDRGIRDFAGLYSVDEPTTEMLIRNAEMIVDYQIGNTVKGGDKVRVGNWDAAVPEFKRLDDLTQPPARADLEAAVHAQFRLAIGRKATPEEVGRFVKLYEGCVSAEGDRLGATRTMLQAVLLKTDAVYRSELGGGTGGRRILAPLELARALGLTLGDRRDPALTAAAEKGQLTTPDHVATHVRRMLDDPKTEKPRLLRFFREYFEYHKAPLVFKDNPADIVHRPAVLVNDTDRLILHVLAEDKDVFARLLTTPQSFVNHAVGENKQTRKSEVKPASVPNPYNDKGRKGVEAVYGLDDFPLTQPVELATDRIGILMQPSWLIAWSGNFENDPVRRGRWVRERLLGGTVPDIPIGVDAKVPDEPEHPLRHRLRVTREGRCWACHQKMDDLGLPFEQFDHLGRLRKTETVADKQGHPTPDPKTKRPVGPSTREVRLDTTGEIAHAGDAALDGPVRGPAELVRKLAASDHARQVFVRHAFRYFVGRNESLADARSLQRADQAYVQSGGSFKALVVSLLTSDSFLFRSAPLPGDRK